MKLASGLLIVSLLILSATWSEPRAEGQPPKDAKDQGPKQYKMGPDHMSQDGVPKGKLEGPILFKSNVFKGTVRYYWLYVPAQYDAKNPANVVVFQDGQRAANPKGVMRVPQVMENLIHKKEIPVAIGIFITPGQKGDAMPAGFTFGSQNPGNRSVEYDSLGDAYARFLIDEMLPEVGKKYNLTKRPEGRVIGGTSSGAICAFNVAWERPNEFRRVISAIGSFTNIRGGNVFPDLVRKTAAKPIRVFLQDGSNDLKNNFGDWFKANQAMVAAFEEKKYDLKYVFTDGKHADDHGGAMLPDMLRWLWRDEPGMSAKKTVAPINIDLAKFVFKAKAGTSALNTHNQNDDKLCFYTNGWAEATLKIAVDGEYEIGIKASCDPAMDENAKFKLTVDGQQIGKETTLTTGDEKEYTLTATLKQGERKIVVEFTNDAYKEGEYDRNLYVHGVTLKFLK
ncbi:MAG TPA: carbohydrate-binding domain-containing protein, partial [Gemmataceae bacterium]|nr:carbohydrate-binding domain-containing protein [Gemmataceae bacterium]